ncbi:MAG: cupin domain-containing protein [Sphingobacteriaceae bacterium]|nr:MAG: cupin domain-containing protein [Sphingobacteriaceae bacterium]
MTAAEFLQLGLIETYCLGFTSREEDMLVQKMADMYPEIAREIEKVKESFHHFLQKRTMDPSPAVKTAVMRNIYNQQVSLKKEWVPLMHETVDFKRYYECAAANNVHVSTPVVAFDNLFAQELPSTNEVINFAVWAKQGHEEETHDDRNEFIAILEGSCEMYMNGKMKAYAKGEIITIPPHIPHYAVVTSAQPMFALVQRQLLG